MTASMLAPQFRAGRARVWRNLCAPAYGCENPKKLYNLRRRASRGRVLNPTIRIDCTSKIWQVIAARATEKSGRDFRRRGSVRRFKRSEEHTSELQSRQYLVCRLLLEKKK